MKNMTGLLSFVILSVGSFAVAENHCISSSRHQTSAISRPTAQLTTAIFLPPVSNTQISPLGQSTIGNSSYLPQNNYGGTLQSPILNTGSMLPQTQGYGAYPTMPQYGNIGYPGTSYGYGYGTPNYGGVGYGYGGYPSYGYGYGGGYPSYGYGYGYGYPSYGYGYGMPYPVAPYYGYGGYGGIGNYGYQYGSGYGYGYNYGIGYGGGSMGGMYGGGYYPPYYGGYYGMMF